MQVLKSDPSPYSKVFLVKGKGGNPASRRDLAEAEFEVLIFVCVLFFRVWCSLCGSVLCCRLSLSSRSLLRFLSVWLFAFAASSTTYVRVWEYSVLLSSLRSLISLPAFLFFALRFFEALIRALWSVLLSTSWLCIFLIFVLLDIFHLDFCIFDFSTFRFSLLRLFDFCISDLSRVFQFCHFLFVFRFLDFLTFWFSSFLFFDFRAFQFLDF